MILLDLWSREQSPFFYDDDVDDDDGDDDDDDGDDDDDDGDDGGLSTRLPSVGHKTYNDVCRIIVFSWFSWPKLTKTQKKCWFS